MYPFPWAVTGHSLLWVPGFCAGTHSVRNRILLFSWNSFRTWGASSAGPLPSPGIHPFGVPGRSRPLIRQGGVRS
jgi:hypothetical protein